MTNRQVERMTLWLVSFVLWPLVQIIAAFSSALASTAHLALTLAGAASRGYAFNDGASPASMNSGNMPQSSIVNYYNRVFMDFLAPNLVGMRQCTRMTMPEHSGQTFVNFMMQPLGPNTVQQLEGTVGSPITASVNFKGITLGQWADFMNFSDRAFLTSISDDLVNYRRNMALRLGLTLDNLIQANFDYLRVLDSRTGNQDATVAPYKFDKAMLEQMPASLLGANVKPFPGGYFYGKVHPFFIGDAMIDTGNNSIVDIWKHTNDGQAKLEELTQTEDGGNIPVFELAGARWMSSTTVSQIPNYLGSGQTALATYLAGQDAMIFVNLPREGTSLGDGKWQNISLWAGEYQRSAFDPAGVIKAGTSYNVILGIGVPPDTISRARIAYAVPQTT